MSTTTPSPLPASQTALFQETIHMTLYLWDALSISAVNDPRASTPGAIDSIRANLAEAVWDEFCSPTTPSSFSIPPSNSSSGGSSVKVPHPEDLEALLFDFMEQVFDVLVDDDSLIPTAEALVRRFQIVAAGGGGGGGAGGAEGGGGGGNEELVTLRRKFEEKKARGGDRAVKATVGEPNQDTDGSDDEEEGSEGEGEGGRNGEGDGDRMDGVVRQGQQQQQQVSRREKPVPEVDEDGFTMVSRKR